MGDWVLLAIAIHFTHSRMLFRWVFSIN